MEIEVRNVRSNLVGFTPDQANQVYKRLLTFAPGYRFTKLYKQRKWNGKVSLFNRADSSFPSGLLPVVVEMYPNVRITDLRGIVTPTLYNPTVPLRDYQLDAVMRGLSNTLYGAWWPRGVYKVATGGGKTEIAAAILEMTRVHSLFIVHRTQLVNQTVERFQNYGIGSGIIASGKVDMSSDVTVATIQSLMSFKHAVNKTKTRDEEKVAELRRRKAQQGKTIKQFLLGIEQVFIDEAHLAGAKQDKANLFTHALSLMPNAYMRWGLTATPFMREEFHDWMLEGATGQILYEVKSRVLIDGGWLAEPKITIYRVKVKSYGEWSTDYDMGIVMNKTRNEKIIQCIQDRPGPTMVLVQRIPHGDTLISMCKDKGIPVKFLYGKVSIEEREQALEDLKVGTLKAVIGSTIWDEGLDVAEIRTLILAGAGKSKIKNLQRLGRGLRLSTGKQEVEVIDFFEEGSKWLRQHALQRRKLWTDEGYDVKVT